MTGLFVDLLFSQLHDAAASISAVKDDELRQKLAQAMLDYAKEMLRQEHVPAPQPAPTTVVATPAAPNPAAPKADGPSLAQATAVPERSK